MPRSCQILGETLEKRPKVLALTLSFPQHWHYWFLLLFASTIALHCCVYWALFRAVSMATFTFSFELNVGQYKFPVTVYSMNIHHSDRAIKTYHFIHKTARGNHPLNFKVKAAARLVVGWVANRTPLRCVRTPVAVQLRDHRLQSRAEYSSSPANIITWSYSSRNVRQYSSLSWACTYLQ